MLTLHAILFASWVLLTLIQSLLARIRKITLHRRLGLSGAVIGAAMPFVGIAVAIVMKRWRIAHTGETSIVDLSFPLNDMLAFGIAFGLAMVWRKRPDRHRRLILVASSALTGAAFARFPIEILRDYAFYAGVDLLILLGMGRDLLVEGRVHPVYRIALPALLSGQALAFYLTAAAPVWWQSAVAYVVS